MNALPGYDTWKTASPDDDAGPEPSAAHIEEAFDLLVADSDLLADFISDEQPDYTTPFQLYHKYGGLPFNNSERDDNLRESWQITMDGFFEHYRDWLGDRLTNKAYEVMQAEIQASRDEAAEAAADDRYFERNFG